MKKWKKEDENLAIGISLGLIFGLLLDNLALGLALGIVFGSVSKVNKKK